jgi:putative addiction module component (TIGR02574 family)
MTEVAEQLKSQLERLPPEDRSELAYFLLQSLKSGEEGGAAAWDQEIARRVSEIRGGRAAGRPAEEVLAELRDEYP